MAAVYGGLPEGAGLSGVSNGPILNSFFDVLATGQTDCVAVHQIPAVTKCTAVNKTGNQEDYFFKKQNPPLKGWDFSHIWQEAEGHLPILRGFEPGFQQ